MRSASRSFQATRRFPNPAMVHITARFPFLVLAFFLISSLSSPISADELSVISHPAKLQLQLPPGQPVENSSGTKPGSVVTCNRIYINGLSRLRHLSKFAHSLKVKVSVAQGDGMFRTQPVELCFHRNASLGVGMCPPGEWQRLAKGSWGQSISPYGTRILDIRMLPDPSRSVEVSTEQEFMFHRVIFLLLGIVMMATARALSESVVFYYGSAMAAGVILVILMILFQGMRMLPTGRKSSLAIFMYSSIVGVATFLLRYLSGLLRTLLVEIGIGEEMHNPLGMFLLVCIVLAGAWFGFWGVRKLVLTEDGLVDSSVAYFVEWSILIFAAVMILQSSLDTLLAAEALVFATIITRTRKKSRFLRHLYKKIARIICRTRVQISPSKYSHGEYPSKIRRPGSELPRPRAKNFTLASCTSPALGLTKTPPQRPLEEETYYSTFHDTPERKKFSKQDWEAFTRDHTRKALGELVNSPDFNQWALANAERITVTPPEDSNREKKQRKFHWF